MKTASETSAAPVANVSPSEAGRGPTPASISTAKATNATTPASTPASGRSLRRRRNPWPLRLGILGALVVVVALFVLAARPKPIMVDTTVVERGTVRDEISSANAGEVTAELTATVRAEVAGRVLAVRHQRGERVKKGEVVVALDSADLDARVRQAQATLEAQRAQVLQAEAHAVAAARTAERDKQLALHGAETAQRAEDTASQATEAQATLGVARAQLEQAQAALQVAKVARAHADLTAPFDGLLSDVPEDPGDEVQMGAGVFEIVDDSRLHVEATIDEADIAKVKVGQPATLRLDALPNHPIAGVVSKLNPTVRKDEKGARTLRIEVEVVDLAAAVAAGVKAGMSANVDVRVAETPSVLNLPSHVIVGHGMKRTVFVIENGRAHEQEVHTGMSSWERTEIVSGLKEGDRVVADLNAKGLADGVPVVSGASVEAQAP